MAIKPRPNVTIEDMLRGLEKEERTRGRVDKSRIGLLDVSGDSIGRSSTPDPMQGPQHEATGPYSNSVVPKQAEPPRMGGILGTAPSPPARKGLLPGLPGPRLLDPTPPQAAPRAPRSRVAQAGNFLDDLLFGGAAGERSAERRARDQQEAVQAAHRDAFAFASTEQGFDPNRYGQRMAELGHAPGMADIVNLEGVNDGRDVRGQRQRTERRSVQGGALAPVLGLPADQQAAGYAEANRYLEGEGFGMGPNMSPSGVTSAVGASMGADSFLDNQRGDRVQSEAERQNVAAENYRNQDLTFRQGESEWERQYRLSRASADDQYRAQELDLRREALTIPNSTGDVLAPILNKVATMGEAALNSGEAAIWKRYQDSGQAAGMWGAPPALPGVTAPQAQPQGQPQQQAPRAPQGDPFPGIAEGEILTQDGKRYQRRGAQMVEVN